MTYLDIAPMLTAMRQCPADFTMNGNFLVHRKSHHWFTNMSGQVQVHAACDCSTLAVSQEQSAEYQEVFAAWIVTYWEPHLAAIEAKKREKRINAQFRKHFVVSRFRRVLAWLRKPSQPAVSSDVVAPVRPKYDLGDLVSQMKPEHVHSEIEW